MFSKFLFWLVTISSASFSVYMKIECFVPVCITLPLSTLNFIADDNVCPVCRDLAALWFSVS